MTETTTSISVTITWKSKHTDKEATIASSEDTERTKSTYFSVDLETIQSGSSTRIRGASTTKTWSTTATAVLATTISTAATEATSSSETTTSSPTMK